MLNKSSKLDWLRIEGQPKEIGYQLGSHARDAVHGTLIQTGLWKEITSLQHRNRVYQMMTTTERLFPEQWAELQGLAEGLALPFEDVFAWNCRGDLLMDTADGCTTVMLPGDEITLAHNEDGLPCLNGHCFIAQVEPTTGVPFFSFCYPGSIPGHTFTYFDDGRAFTVNNLRLNGRGSDIPRMVLSRALLSCNTIADMLELIEKNPPCGGFHLCILDHHMSRLHSVEMGAGQSVHKVLNDAQVHANHALMHVNKKDQKVTQSSYDRQHRGDQLIASGCRDVLSILRDQWSDGLPIYREEADDPDNENTLATFVLTLQKRDIHWRIYCDKQGAPAFSG